MSKVLPTGTVVPGFTSRVTPDHKIKSDFLAGVRSGVNGTPSFFVNGHQHEGSDAFEDLVAAIEQHLHAKASLRHDRSGSGLAP
jgi:hypothetical protein